MTVIDKDVFAVVGGGGYVGLTTAVELAHLGHEVWCVDIESEKIKELDEGTKPQFKEPGLEAALNEVRHLLHFTTDHAEALKHARFVVIAVETPAAEANAGQSSAGRGNGSPDYDGDSHPVRGGYDLGRIEAAVKQLAELGLEERHVIVMKSTVPCRTGDFVRKALAEAGFDAAIGYISWPEFLKEGTALNDLKKPDRIVIGCSDRELGEEFAALFDDVDCDEVYVMGVESAELVKLASNGWLASQISFVNALANLCDKHAPPFDIREVTRRMERSTIPGAFLKAGIGYGGSCFPKDVLGLRGVAHDARYDFELLDAVMEQNDEQVVRGIRKLEKALDTLEGKTIAVLGIAFKSGTDDTRGSVVVPIIEALAHHGAVVRVFDPKAKKFDDRSEERLRGRDYVHSEDVKGCLAGAHAALVATDCKHFDDIRWGDYEGELQIVVDGRNILTPGRIRQAGIAYDGIGGRVHGLEVVPPDDATLDELADEAAHALLAVKDAFMAEISAIADEVGAEWGLVARGVACDRRIGPERLLEWHADHAELEGALTRLEQRAKGARSQFTMLDAARVVWRRITADRATG